MSKFYRLTNNPLFCHAFNSNGTLIAVSANSDVINIYEIPQAPSASHNYRLVSVLAGHNATVTGVDWAHSNNRIVSCSADRNSFVWNEQKDKSWKPTLVHLQINHAAICVKWSPREDKFAVGTGSKMVTISYFNQENDWWLSKQIKKSIKSTVTAVDWHPNNKLIACGSCDFKVRVFCAKINEVDQDSENSSEWGDMSTFGQLLFVAKTPGGWVHSLSFSIDGQQLAWSAHNSTLAVVNAGSTVPSILSHNFLPFTCIQWIKPKLIAAAGHDFQPMIFEVTNINSEVGIKFCLNLDKAGYDSSDASLKSSGGTSKISAMDMFKQMDSFASFKKATVVNDSQHANTINEIRIVKKGQDGAETISTIGREGAMVIWNLNSVCQQLKNLSIS